MKAFHLLGAAPLYTNSFVLISEAGHAVVIAPAAEVQEYDKIFKENNATLTTILCTHGHYDHVGAVAALKKATGCKVYMDPVDAQGSQLLPLTPAQRTAFWRKMLDEESIDLLHEGHLNILKERITNAINSFRAEP